MKTRIPICDCCKKTDSRAIFRCKNRMICKDCNFVISWYIPLIINGLISSYE